MFQGVPNMLSPAIAKDVIDHAMFLGADFAELFVEQSRTHSIELISNEIDKINGGIDFGMLWHLYLKLINARQSVRRD